MASYAQAMEIAKGLQASGQLPPGTTIGMMAQQIMGGAEAMPERGGMPPMTTGLLESVRAGAQPPVQADPIAAETAARQARAAQAGGVSPEMEALYAAREARLGKEEERIGKDEKRAAWDALAQMGFKMAQTTSPYFATALAEGMQAGTTGYNAAKIDAAERKAKVLDGKENVALARLKDRQAAIAANEEAYRGDVKAAGENIGLSKAASEATKAAIEAANAGEMTKAELQKAISEIAYKDAQRENVEQETRLAPGVAAAQIANYRETGGGGAGGGVSQTTLWSDLQNEKANVARLSAVVNKAIAAQRAANAANDPETSLAASIEAKAARGEYDAAVARQREIQRMMSGGRGAPAAKPAAKGYDFTYVKGKGMMPAR